MQDVHMAWCSQVGLRTMLFVLAGVVNSSQHTIEGYLEELTSTPKNQQLPILLQMQKANQRNSVLADHIKKLYLLSGLKESLSKNVHIEELLTHINEQFVEINLSISGTYRSSLVTLENDAFVTALGILISIATTRKKISTHFRKRGGIGVLELHTPKPTWIKPAPVLMIRNFDYMKLPNKSMELHDLIIWYALAVLQSLSVGVKIRKHHGAQRVYVTIPLARQLNVFDTVHKHV